MLHNSRIQQQATMLDRPRVSALIRDGLEYPLHILLAGPGYGKTQAMLSYVKNIDAGILWIRLTELDNLTAHFWNHILQSLDPNYPNLVKSLRSLGFPETLSSFDAFIDIIEKNRTGKELLCVFDDFGVITDVRIQHFFRMLAGMDEHGFHVVLITNTFASVEPIAFQSSRRHMILTKDLKFTRDEIEELYWMHGMQLDDGELSKIERQTEGWPFSLHLLAQQQNKVPDTLFNDETAISYLFEARFFSAYSRQWQLLLTRLSLLDHFTRELAAELYDGAPAELEVLVTHVFVTQEATTGRLFLHYLYKRFLQDKQYLLTEEYKLHTWATAAKHYEATGDTIQAIVCYRNCEDHVNMVDVIASYVKAQTNIIDKSAYFLLPYLDQMSPEERWAYPLADYLRAWIFVSLVELEKTELLCYDLEQRFLSESTPDSRDMLGEVYILLGLVHTMRSKYDFGDYFEKAATYLPQGSNFLKTTGTSTLLNNHNFTIADNTPGAKEKMEQAAHYGMPRMAKVMHGTNSGSEHIFSAEAAYLSHDLETAQEHAYRAIYCGQADGLHDLACSGYYLLAHIDLLQGDLREMTKNISSIAEYADKRDIGALKNIRDTAMAWYYLELHEYTQIPRSVLEMNYGDKPATAYGRDEILYAKYLLLTKEYSKLIGMLEHPRGFHRHDGIRHDRIYLYILLATSHKHLDHADAAIKCLWTAYDMCYNNGLVTPFIAAEKNMIELVKIARQQNEYQFNTDWLNYIEQEAEVFSRRAKVVRATFRKQNPRKASADNPLSKREKEVLHGVAQGLTREEIAIQQYVSVNTVKSTIRNIYNKLDANNKGDAISIAIAKGYIEGYTEE